MSAEWLLATITSWSPLATRTGCRMAPRSCGLLIAERPDGLELGADGQRRDALVAILRALLQPRHVVLGGALPVRSPGEEEVVLGVLQGERASDVRSDGDLRDLVDATTSGRTGAGEDDFANELGSSSVITWATPPPRENRGDRPVEAQGADEGDGVAAIDSTECGTDPPDAPIPSVVEGDHPTLCRDAVDDPRIPVVEDRGQVVQEDQWHAGVCTKLPVGELDPADVDGLGRRVLPRRVHSRTPGRVDLRHLLLLGPHDCKVTIRTV